MRNRALLIGGLLTVMLAACGSSDRPNVVEQIVVREPGEPMPASAVEPGADAALTLVARGEDAFQMCTGCHEFESGAPSGAGPNLHGVVGRVAGSLEGYPYSDALVASRVTWDEASLDLFLADPEGYIPGSEMLVGTVADAEDRAAIVAYLASAQSGSGE